MLLNYFFSMCLLFTLIIQKWTSWGLAKCLQIYQNQTLKEDRILNYTVSTWVTDTLYNIDKWSILAIDWNAVFSQLPIQVQRHTLLNQVGNVFFWGEGQGYFLLSSLCISLQQTRGLLYAWHSVLDVCLYVGPLILNDDLHAFFNFSSFSLYQYFWYKSQSFSSISNFYFHVNLQQKRRYIKSI